MRGARLLGVIALLATLVVPGCRRSEARPLPPRPQIVEVAMREYRFEYDAPEARGRVVFRAHNGGERPHNLVLVTLGDDVPPLDQQLRGSERRFVSTIAALPERRPGATGTFAVDLQPGRYGLICFITDDDGRSHAQTGMSSEFRVS